MTGSPPGSDERLDAIEDELYGAAPDDFVARRDGAARAAKEAGDRQLADAIRSLRRPTAAAWALNSFARSEPAAIDALLDLGVRLRDAVTHGDGDEIRTLMRERARSTAATMADLRRHAERQGRPLSPSVASQAEQTLRAALSSDDAARRVRRGVLPAALADTGLEALGAPAATRTSRSTVRSAAPDRSRADERRRRDAERRANEAAERLAAIEQELDAVAERRQELDAERSALRSRLHEVDGLLHELRTVENEVQSRLRSARSELRSARASAGLGSPAEPG